jgi:hypothetical protein
MITQGQLDFSTPPPSPAATEVDRLIRHLLDRPGFHTAHQLAQSLDLTDRKIRQLAEHSDGLIVSGPGSPGYCHLHHCPAEKISHIADTLRSQARSMLSRSIRLRRQAHSLIR